VSYFKNRQNLDGVKFYYLLQFVCI